MLKETSLIQLHIPNETATMAEAHNRISVGTQRSYEHFDPLFCCWVAPFVRGVSLRQGLNYGLAHFRHLAEVCLVRPMDPPGLLLPG